MSAEIQIQPSGLTQRLKVMAAALCTPCGVAHHLIAKGRERRLDGRIEQELYEIAQEAIRNSLKHAQATAVHVELNFRRNLVQMALTDNGCGIAGPILANHRKKGREGIFAMQDRAALIGATFRIDSEEGLGTRIQVDVPMKDTSQPSSAGLRRWLLRIFKS